MSSERKTVLSYFVLPYIAISLVIIAIVVIFFQTNGRYLLSLSGDGILITYFGILAVMHIVLKFTIGKLPNLTETKISLTWISFTILACSVCIASAIYYFNTKPKQISQVEEILTYPSQEYFFLTGQTKLKFFKNASSYHNHYDSKHGAKYNISYHLGGVVDSSRGDDEIYLFVTDHFYYGKEFSLQKAAEMANVANKKLSQKIDRFLLKGGYLKRVDKERKVEIGKMHKFYTKKPWFSASQNFAISENPSSLLTLMISFSIIFLVFVFVPAILAIFSEVDKNSIELLEKEPSIYRRFFGKNVGPSAELMGTKLKLDLRFCGR